MNSILTSIKKLLGMEADYTQFDTDIIIHINSALMALTQIGVGSETGFIISDSTATWTDFLGDRKDVEAVKSYIYLKVRLIFDPPTSSFVIEAIKQQIAEFEWRLQIQTDPPLVPDPVVVEEPIF